MSGRPSHRRKKLVRTKRVSRSESQDQPAADQHTKTDHVVDDQLQQQAAEDEDDFSSAFGGCRDDQLTLQPRAGDAKTHSKVKREEGTGEAEHSDTGFIVNNCGDGVFEQQDPARCCSSDATAAANSRNRQRRSISDCSSELVSELSEVPHGNKGNNNAEEEEENEFWTRGSAFGPRSDGTVGRADKASSLQLATAYVEVADYDRSSNSRSATETSGSDTGAANAVVFDPDNWEQLGSTALSLAAVDWASLVEQEEEERRAAATVVYSNSFVVNDSDIVNNNSSSCAVNSTNPCSQDSSVASVRSASAKWRKRTAARGEMSSSSIQARKAQQNNKSKPKQTNSEHPLPNQNLNVDRQASQNLNCERPDSQQGESCLSDDSCATSWIRPSVRAVQLQEAKKGSGDSHSKQQLRGNGSLPQNQETQLVNNVSLQTESATKLPNYNKPCGPHHVVSDSDSVGSLPSSAQSSVLVDMGKVVGLLRNCPGNDSEELSHSDYELKEESPLICASCEIEGFEEEDDFCGDPLVYATFVAPIQQYSTETEPSRQQSVASRQPSVNSRQPSFKQNSSDTDNQTQTELTTGVEQNSLTVPGLTVSPASAVSAASSPTAGGHGGQPTAPTPTFTTVVASGGAAGGKSGSSGSNGTSQSHLNNSISESNHWGERIPTYLADESQVTSNIPPVTREAAECQEAGEHQIYESAGMEDAHGGQHGDVECVTTMELNRQLSQERLSFIHSQSSREGDDEEHEYDVVPLPPPPHHVVPLPPAPPPPAHSHHMVPLPPPPPAQSHQIPLPVPPPPAANSAKQARGLIRGRGTGGGRCWSHRNAGVRRDDDEEDEDEEEDFVEDSDRDDEAGGLMMDGGHVGDGEEEEEEEEDDEDYHGGGRASRGSDLDHFHHQTETIKRVSKVKAQRERNRTTAVVVLQQQDKQQHQHQPPTCGDGGELVRQRPNHLPYHHHHPRQETGVGAGQTHHHPYGDEQHARPPYHHHLHQHHGQQQPLHHPNGPTNATTTIRSKSRSKSQSPGREMDLGGGGGQQQQQQQHHRAIVIVHHTTCSSSGGSTSSRRSRTSHHHHHHQHPHHRGSQPASRRTSREASPDNLSESSISFHENEVITPTPPQHHHHHHPQQPAASLGSVSSLAGGVEGRQPYGQVGSPWYDGEAPIHPCVSVSRDTLREAPANSSNNNAATSSNSSHNDSTPIGNNNQSAAAARQFKYANWDSVRDSWMSTGGGTGSSNSTDCLFTNIPPPTYSGGKTDLAGAAAACDTQGPVEPPAAFSRVSGKSAADPLQQQHKSALLRTDNYLSSSQGSLPRLMSGNNSSTLPRAAERANNGGGFSAAVAKVTSQHKQQQQPTTTLQGVVAACKMGKVCDIGESGSSSRDAARNMRQSSRDSGGSSSSKQSSSRPLVKPNNRSHSPGNSCSKQGVSLGKLGGSGRISGTGSPSGQPGPSRDSTPTDGGGSSIQSAQSLQPLDLEQEVGASDLVSLHPISEEAIIENLHSRFKSDQIYTWMSTVLVSINSYKKLCLYTPEVIDAYRSQCLNQLPPHIYSSADRAWHSLRDRGEDQAVILTGESGSGKTEAGKLVLQYIAAVTHHSAEFHNIKYQLLQSNPVLEAFGNAKTLHNDNSSRFGKYIEVSFDFKGDPTGGSITNYLLEKTRVTTFPAEERNFHIFYQVLAGADIHTLKDLRLQRNVDSYTLLRYSGKPTRSAEGNSSLNDRRDFHITKKALDDLGFSNEDVSDILRLVASVLKLGNLNFVPITNMDGTEGCTIGNEYELYDVGLLLGSDTQSLKTGLLTRTVSVGADLVASDLSSVEAVECRDRLCRTIYTRLFTWIVNKINTIIKVKTHKKHKVLGILDIYGFEAFQQNGFEQLIINFSNEKIHQLLIEWTFRREQEEILQEGIQWNQIGYFSNSVICNLIESNSHGILAQLDQVSLKYGLLGAGAPVGAMNSCGSPYDPGLYASDLDFLASLNESFSAHPHYQPPTGHHNEQEANPVPANSFRIKHYAGSVTYSVQGFLAKNCDSVDQDISRVMFQSHHPILSILFPEGNSKRATRRRPATVGTQFKISLGALINNLSSKFPHYVRCIKPNENKAPRIFDNALVQHQIRYLGLVEFGEMRSRGFVWSQAYSSFLHRYKMLCQHTWPTWHSSPVEGVTYLLREVPISGGEYVFGRTKIFLRSVSTLDQLESWRTERIDELVVNIQKVWRGFIARKRWAKLRESQIVISAYWKRWKEKSHVNELKLRRQTEWAAMVLQKNYRHWQRKRWLRSLAHSLPSESPVSRDWPAAPPSLQEASYLIRKLYHRWRCERFRERFDQTSRNRMREKVTASLIFKDRKSSYPRSIGHPFLGDYVRLRQNPQWKKICTETNDQYVVFADIINKITRTGGKFVPILFVISTSSMLILDQRTMQIKYRVPAGEICRLSLSPYWDDIAVFHVRASSPTREVRSQANIPGCLSSEAVKRKGDFVFQTGHVIEIVTKLFLVVQNATGKPPNINIATEFDANFGTHNVTFHFKCGSGEEQSIPGGHVKLIKKGHKMDVVL